MDDYKKPYTCSGLSLRNFRGFQTASIRFAPLTFLVGPNNSGKSSISDSFLFVAQSEFMHPRYLGVLPRWSGSLVDLGSFNDTIYRHQAHKVMSIALDFGTEFLFSPFSTRRSPRMGRNTIRLKFTLGTSGDGVGRLRAIEVVDLRSSAACEIMVGPSDLVITSAGRRRIVKQSPQHGPISQQIMMVLQHEIRQRVARHSRIFGERAGWKRLVDFFGSYAAFMFLGSTQRVSSARAAPSRWYPLQSASPEFEQRRLFDSVDPQAMSTQRTGERQRRRTHISRGSLNVVLKDLDIASSIRNRRLSPYHEALYLADSVTGVTSNLMDMGFGASQAIPIVQACTDLELSRVVGPLIIEQPEIHLHPRAQGTLADLICKTSKKRQVIVETHSVHFINHARILIAQGAIPPEHVVVNYISRTRRGSDVQEIPIKRNGDFLHDWPGGFFDERYRDTLQLLELKSVQDDNA